MTKYFGKCPPETREAKNAGWLLKQRTWLLHAAIASSDQRRGNGQYWVDVAVCSAVYLSPANGGHRHSEKGKAIERRIDRLRVGAMLYAAVLLQM
jgi:hypothetical protein